MSTLTLKLWGVRGSTPSPGPTTVRHGGNTPCISIEMGEKCLVIDAGTGIRGLGKYLVPSRYEIFVLLTHEHWDHIQGFPFFLPIYQKDRIMTMFPVERGMDFLCSLIDQMDGAHFPVTYKELPSHQECYLGDPMEFLNRSGFKIRRQRTNHPGKCFGYRIDHGKHSIVFMPDNELHPPGKQWTHIDELAKFCHGADILMHDGQFMPSDMPMKRGWGHSLASEACELAARAGVGHLLLFHHDPDRTDDELDVIETDCRAWMAKHSPKTKVSAAAEGMTFTF
ncbi:MAG TPA: MBL fold metallo-hydrolase [Tepidisphaeraceae bacterium]|nr:MBL fold metallo-hydrolase [Tepidisphaeraceae bacterium]